MKWFQKITKTKNGKIILAILLAGLAVRIFLFTHYLGKSDFFYDDDSYGYIQIAENIRLGNGFSWFSSPPFEPDGFRTPLYSLFLLGHRLLFGTYTAALVTQTILSVIIAFWIYLIAKDFLSRPGTGLAASTVFLFMPFSIMVSLNFLTQTVFTFTLTAAVLLWLKFLRNSEAKYFYSCAILLPMCALIRPIAFLIPIPFLASLLIKTRSNHEDFLKSYLRRCLFAILIFVGIISPWLLRNYKVFNSFSLSTITYYQLYFYDLSYIYGKVNGISMSEASIFLEDDLDRISGLPDRGTNHEYARDFKHSALLKERFFHYLRQAPITAAITRIELMFKFFIRDGIRYWFHYYNLREGWGTMAPIIIERLILLIIFAGLAITTISGVLSRDWNDALVPITMFLIIGYFDLLTGVMASAGLRYPAEPFILLLGISGIHKILKLCPKF